MLDMVSYTGGRVSSRDITDSDARVVGSNMNKEVLCSNDHSAVSKSFASIYSMR